MNLRNLVCAALAALVVFSALVVPAAAQGPPERVLPPLDFRGGWGWASQRPVVFPNQLIVIHAAGIQAAGQQLGDLTGGCSLSFHGPAGNGAGAHDVRIFSGRMEVWRVGSPEQAAWLREQFIASLTAQCGRPPDVLPSEGVFLQGEPVAILPPPEGVIELQQWPFPPEAGWEWLPGPFQVAPGEMALFVGKGAQIGEDSYLSDSCAVVAVHPGTHDEFGGNGGNLHLFSGVPIDRQEEVLAWFIANSAVVHAGCYEHQDVYRVGLCPDVNGDTRVDVGDIMEVASRWRTSASNPDPDDNPTTPNYATQFDIDEDGDIDIADVMLVVSRWGKLCPAV